MSAAGRKHILHQPCLNPYERTFYLANSVKATVMSDCVKAMTRRQERERESFREKGCDEGGVKGSEDPWKRHVPHTKNNNMGCLSRCKCTHTEMQIFKPAYTLVCVCVCVCVCANACTHVDTLARTQPLILGLECVCLRECMHTHVDTLARTQPLILGLETHFSEHLIFNALAPYGALFVPEEQC